MARIDEITDGIHRISTTLDIDGDGTPVVLLHGLTAGRRYVVHGSRALERSGHRVIALSRDGRPV